VKPLLLRGGRVIDPLYEVDAARDLLIVDGEVEALEPAGTLKPPDGAEVIEVTGSWVIPGLIDPHVHLRDPGFPEKETILTGLRAAAAGGFVAVAAMANTSPVNDRPEITRYMLERAQEAHAARLIPVSAVTKGLGGRELADFGAMAAAGARMFSDDGIPLDDQVVLSDALERVSRLGFAISLHEEDLALTGRGAINAGETSKRLGVAGIPATAETSRVRRDLAIAVGSGAAVHIAHISAADSVELVRAAKKRAANVTCEATPHHFTLDDGAILKSGPNAKMAPPLRSREDVEAVLHALADGTIDMIATDHAPHDPVSKKMESLARFFGTERDAKPLPPDQAEEFAHAANGVVGLETAVGLALGLVHRGLIGPSRLVELMSLNPARLLRLETNGTLAVGARADVTVIDPNLQWTVDPAKFLSKSRNTPFGGMNLKGGAVMTVVAGRIIYDGRVARVS
jgi:dihydroorotase